MGVFETVCFEGEKIKIHFMEILDDDFMMFWYLEFDFYGALDFFWKFLIINFKWLMGLVIWVFYLLSVLTIT